MLEGLGDTFLVVGLGSIGQRHVRNLLALRPGARIVALRSGRGERPVPQELPIHSISSLDELPAGSIRGALVCNPSSLHVDTARELLARGIHLFMEKPLSHNLEGVRELLAEARRRGLLISLAYPFRQHPLVLKLKSLLGEGPLGRPLYLRASVGQHPPDWLPAGMDYRNNYAVRAELGGGALLTLIHELDLALFLLGRPNSVQARVGNLSELQTNADDLAELWLNYDRALASIHMDFFQRGRGDNRYLQVAAEGGRAWLDLQAQELRVYLGRSDSPVVDKLTDFDLNSLYVSELQEFLDCLESGAQPAAGPTEGALAVQVAEAARLSQRTGVAVFVEDLE